jgi:hypothetical protein
MDKVLGQDYKSKRDRIDFLDSNCDAVEDLGYVKPLPSEQLDELKIEKIDNPLTFKFDNEDDMRAVKAFTKTLVESGDINKAFASLKVEREQD